MELLDSRGRVVWVEDLGPLAAGRHRQQMPVHLLAEGRYLARIQAQIGKDLSPVSHNLSFVVRR